MVYAKLPKQNKKAFKKCLFLKTNLDKHNYTSTISFKQFLSLNTIDLQLTNSQ